MRRIALALAVLLLAGCGGGEEGAAGGAELWITRDRGAEVLLEADVASGQTVMEALRGEAEVETRYGGRFVQAIDGVAGSLARGWDWFYFVNGVAPDRGAADFRLRAGDVAWFDYRRWGGEAEVPVVVGAFPEPFVHGFDGERREAVVTYESPAQRAGAEAIAELIGGRVVAGKPPPGANVFAVVAGRPHLRASAESARGPYRFSFAGDAAALAREPESVRFRYEVP
jgi:hypothetical protein